MDLKAEHFERQVQTLEQERGTSEKKYEVREINQWLLSLLTPPLSTGASREVPGVEERARRARCQHGRTMITPRLACVCGVGLL